MRPNLLLGLIWIQIVCKGNQWSSKFLAWGQGISAVWLPTLKYILKVSVGSVATKGFILVYKNATDMLIFTHMAILIGHIRTKTLVTIALAWYKGYNYHSILTQTTSCQLVIQ